MSEMERLVIAGLIRVIEKLCDDGCKKPERIPEYREAVELLKK
jgi:hypothetical protein